MISIRAVISKARALPSTRLIIGDKGQMYWTDIEKIVKG